MQIPTTSTALLEVYSGLDTLQTPQHTPMRRQTLTMPPLRPQRFQALSTLDMLPQVNRPLGFFPRHRRLGREILGHDTFRSKFIFVCCGNVIGGGGERFRWRGWGFYVLVIFISDGAGVMDFLSGMALLFCCAVGCDTVREHAIFLRLDLRVVRRVAVLAGLRLIGMLMLAFAFPLPHRLLRLPHTLEPTLFLQPAAFSSESDSLD